MNKITKKQKRIKGGKILIFVFGLILGSWLVLESKSGLANISKTFNSQKLVQFFSQEIEIDKDSLNNKSNNSQNQDSDKDGLFDWEEQLFGTNPEKADTDGDGYLDGEEIISGYDPLQPGPNDKKADFAIEPRPEPKSIKTKNLTEALGHLLAGRIIYENQNNRQNGKIIFSRLPQIEPIVEEMVKIIQPSEINLSQIKFSASEIKTTPDNSPEKIKEYLKQSQNIIQENITKFNLEEDTIKEVFSYTFNQLKPSPKLNSLINYYQSTIKQLEDLSVPSSLTELHQEQLNVFFLLQKSFESLNYIETDPLRTFLVISQYNLVVQKYNTLQKKIKIFQKRYNVNP